MATESLSSNGTSSASSLVAVATCHKMMTQLQVKISRSFLVIVLYVQENCWMKMAGESRASATEHTATLGQPIYGSNMCFDGDAKTQECPEEANIKHGILGGQQGI